MSMLLEVRNVSRRPQDIEGGRVLAHGEDGQAPDSPHTRSLITSGALLLLREPAPEPVTRRGGGS